MFLFLNCNLSNNFLIVLIFDTQESEEWERKRKRKKKYWDGNETGTGFFRKKERKRNTSQILKHGTGTERERYDIEKLERERNGNELYRILNAGNGIRTRSRTSESGTCQVREKVRNI